VYLVLPSLHGGSLYSPFKLHSINGQTFIIFEHLTLLAFSFSLLTDANCLAVSISISDSWRCDDCFIWSAARWAASILLRRSADSCSSCSIRRSFLSTSSVLLLFIVKHDKKLIFYQNTLGFFSVFTCSWGFNSMHFGIIWKLYKHIKFKYIFHFIPNFWKSEFRYRLFKSADYNMIIWRSN